jgi:ABC-2 type transport system permease protein
VNVLEVGSVSIVDTLPADARAELDKVMTLTKTSDLAAAQEKVRKGDADAAVSQQGDQLNVYYSAADQVKSGAIRTIFQSLVAGPPRATLATHQVEDQSLQVIQFYTPGLLGWALAAGGTAGAALTLVTWRKTKLMRRLRLAPVRNSTILGARVLVSVGIGLAQMAIFIAVASIPYFGLKLTGAWWMAIPLVIAGTFAFLSVGLLVGSFTKSEDAAQGIVQLIVLPMAFLSGAFFPLDGAPSWLQAVSHVMPLRYLVDSMRDVMVRGDSAVSVLPTLGGLLVFALILSVVASRLFRWDEV